jgi:hypothetical protein
MRQSALVIVIPEAEARVGAMLRPTSHPQLLRLLSTSLLPSSQSFLNFRLMEACTRVSFRI